MKKFLLVVLLFLMGCSNKQKTYTPAYLWVNKMEEYLACQGSISVEKTDVGTYILEFEDSNPKLADLPDRHYKHEVTSVDIRNANPHGLRATEACANVGQYSESKAEKSRPHPTRNSSGDPVLYGKENLFAISYKGLTVKDGVTGNNRGVSYCENFIQLTEGPFKENLGVWQFTGTVEPPPMNHDCAAIGAGSGVIVNAHNGQQRVEIIYSGNNGDMQRMTAIPVEMLGDLSADSRSPSIAQVSTKTPSQTLSSNAAGPMAMPISRAEIEAAVAQHDPAGLMLKLKPTVAHVFGSDLSAFDAHSDGAGSVAIKGDEFIFQGCSISNKCVRSVAFSLDLSNGRAAGAISDDDNVQVYKGDYHSENDLPRTLRQWLDGYAVQ